MKKAIMGLIIASSILITNLAFWLINQSQMLFTFPLDGTDWATHIFELWALDKYGFHGLVPDWYNGYKLFEFYYPGWNLFSLPFLKISGNVLIASFVSIIALLIIILIGLFLLGKTQKFSKLQIIGFFAFFAGNALAISNFLRNGRAPELTAWAIFILLAALLFYYKDKNLDYKFLLFIPLFSFLMLSHFATAILFGIFLLGFFLIKSWKEKLYITACSVTSLALISFWLIPLLRGFSTTYVSTLNYAVRFYDNSLFSLGLNLILPIATIILFTLYWKQKNYSKEELLFYSPIIALSLLIAIRFTPLIPILDKLYPGPPAIFLIFFSLLFLFNLKFKSKYLPALLIIGLALCSITINIYGTELFPGRTQFQQEVIDIIPHIDAKYIVAGEGPEFLNWGIYTFASIYYNKQTPWGGWQTTAYTSDYQQQVESTYDALMSSNCIEFDKKLEKLNGNEVLGLGQICQTLSVCGFKEKISTESVCLYEIDI